MFTGDGGEIVCRRCLTFVLSVENTKEKQHFFLAEAHKVVSVNLNSISGEVKCTCCLEILGLKLNGEIIQLNRKNLLKVSGAQISDGMTNKPYAKAVDFYACKRCDVFLASAEDIEKERKQFSGPVVGWGRNLVNILYGEPPPCALAIYTSGRYTASQIYCMKCGEPLGMKSSTISPVPVVNHTLYMKTLVRKQGEHKFDGESGNMIA